MSKDRSDQHWVRRRCVTHFIWAAAIIVWSIPLVAQHWTSQMAWSLADFGMFGGLVAGVALALVHVSQSPHPWSYRLAAVIAAAPSVPGRGRKRSLPAASTSTNASRPE